MRRGGGGEHESGKRTGIPHLNIWQRVRYDNKRFKKYRAAGIFLQIERKLALAAAEEFGESAKLATDGM
jgi:hypothetical protein